MAQLMPFSAVHFNPSIIGDDLGDVIAPPYDIVNTEEGERLRRRHPHNAVRLELTIPVPGDPDAARHHENAANLWAAWRRDGILVKDEKPGLYMCEQEFVHDGVRYVRTSILGLLGLGGSGTGSDGPTGTPGADKGGDAANAMGVIAHEETLPHPKEDRFRLLLACRAQFSPVLILYEDAGAIVADALRSVRASGPPAFTASLEDETLRVWHLTSPDLVGRIVDVLARGPVVIADGHHRSESMRRYAAHVGHPGQARGLAALVSTSDPGVVVLPTHRVLSGWPEAAAARILERLSGSFSIADVPASAAASSVATALSQDDARGLWARLSTLVRSCNGTTSLVAVSRDGARIVEYPGETEEALRSLDAAIERVRADVRGAASEQACDVAYTRDAADALGGVAAGRVQIAFFPPAITADHVLEKAREGYLFPRKTTYFQPKIPAGLLMWDLED